MKLTEREVSSYIEAYRDAPWGENMTRPSSIEFLESFYEDPDAEVKVYREDPDKPPYLYIHIYDYGKNINNFLDAEFGPGAFYVAKNIEPIEQFISEYDSLTYIADLHADKSVPLPDSLKPRLKVLPGLLEELDNKYNNSALALYTHRMSGTFRAVERLNASKFEVKKLSYEIDPVTHHPQNSNSSLDKLELVIIRVLKDCLSLL